MGMIAIPIRDGRFCSHFGGAEAFALYTVDEGNRTVDGRQVLTPPEHGRGIFPVWLRKHGVTTVLAGGIGPRACTIFADHGIEVMLGVGGENPDTMVEAFLAGNLDSSGEACQEHGFHDCGHDHGGGEHVHNPGAGRCPFE